MVCTYNRLVGWNFLSDIEHKQHETDKTKQLFAHRGPGHGAGGCVHAIPDKHVKVPVHLKEKDRKQSLIKSHVKKLLQIKVLLPSGPASCGELTIETSLSFYIKKDNSFNTGISILYDYYRIDYVIIVKF